MSPEISTSVSEAFTGQGGEKVSVDINNVEAHCYVVITIESILMCKYIAESINQSTYCRTFWPHRPSSTGYKTEDTAV